VAIAGDETPMAEFLEGAPMAPEAKRDLAMLYEAPKDWLPGLTDAEKKERLGRMTYAQYLQDVAKVHPDVLTYLYQEPTGEWGYGIDGIGAIDAWAEEYPGFAGLGLDWSRPSRHNSPSIKRGWNANDPYIYHFPEGVAGVTRLLVRALVPGALPGSTMEDEVLARLDYARLDDPGNDVRRPRGRGGVRERRRRAERACPRRRARLLVLDDPVHLR
jgi:spermidine dehydrogenase